jgi:hypothetical protein
MSGMDRTLRGLLDAAKDQPEDDAPRIVLAD